MYHQGKQKPVKSHESFRANALSCPRAMVVKLISSGQQQKNYKQEKANYVSSAHT
jgi:hypothetical protein